MYCENFIKVYMKAQKKKKSNVSKKLIHLQLIMNIKKYFDFKKQ